MFSKKLLLLLLPLCTAVLSEEESATVYGTEVVQNENTRNYTPAIIHSVPRPIPPPIFVQPLPNLQPASSTTSSESTPVQIKPTIPVRPYYRPWSRNSVTPTYTQSLEHQKPHDTYTTPTPAPIPIPTAIPRPYYPPARPTYRPPTYYTQATTAPTSPEPSIVYVEPRAEPTQAPAITEAPPIYIPSPRSTYRPPYNPLPFHPLPTLPEPIPEPTTVPPSPPLYTEISNEPLPLTKATPSPIEPETPLIPQSELIPKPTLPTIIEETTLPATESPAIYVPRATFRPDPSPNLRYYQPAAYPFDYEYSYCNEENAYQPIENECSQYTHCREHRAIKYSCPDGLHFDNTIIYPNYPCNNPFVVGCKYNTVEPSQKPELPTPQPQPTFRPPVPTKTDPPTTIEYYKPTVRPHIEDRYPYCSEEYAYYPVENKCTSYIQCKDHRAIEHTCPVGLHYDEKITYPNYPCSNPSDARCKYYTVEPSHTPELPTPQPHPTFRPPVPKPYPARNYTDFEGRCERKNAYHSLQGQCDAYIECKNHNYMEYLCPDGLHFKPDAVWPEYPCSYPSEVQCQGRTILQTPQPTAECMHQYGFYPIGDSDCSRFLSCQEGQATIVNCPPGLVFNPDISTCDWPENVPSCRPDAFKGFVCPETPRDEYGQPTDLLLNYRYGDSCIQYIACRRGHPRLLSCEEGFAFDDSLGICVEQSYVQNCTSKKLS